MSIVAQSAGVRSSPGDSGRRSTTYFALQSNTVSTLTRYIADRDEELRGSWRESVEGNVSHISIGIIYGFTHTLIH